MYQRKFIDRKEELNFLHARYTTESPEFIVIYGRRRVGKTEYILKFDPKLSFWANVQNNVIKKGTYLSEEIGYFLNASGAI